MRTFSSVAFTVFFFTVLACSAFAADSRYVTDELQITLRQGKGNEFRIVKTLKTGDPLTVLQDEGDYLLVRAADGAEGYVLSRYTMQNKPKSQAVAALTREVESLKEKLSRFEGDSSQQVVQLSDSLGKRDEDLRLLQGTNDQLVERVNQLQAALDSETLKYDLLLDQSGDVTAIVVERDALRTDNEALQREIVVLNEKLARQDPSSMIKWFLAGAVVLLVGWMMGKASRKRRTPW